MKTKALVFSFLLLLLIPPSYGVVSPVFDFNFGSLGLGNGQFSVPEDVTVDSSGNIYVVDTGNNRIQKFDSNGNYLLQFGSTGIDSGQFRAPRGIAVDSSDNIYVVDTINERIEKFDSNGNYLLQFGSLGMGTGQFLFPSGIAVDSSDNIYVVDAINERIEKFDSNGNYLSQFGSYGTGNGLLRIPGAIALDSSGNLYVADTNNHRIQKFDSNGNYLSQFGSYGTGNGQFSVPQGVSVDKYGNVLVSDTGNHRIQKFDSFGNFVLSFGSYGTGDEQFNYPNHITMNGLQGFIADTMNNRIWVFHFPESPIADDKRVVTLEETSISITVTASDANDDPLVYSVVTGPTHGNLTGTAPLLTYHPDADYFGSDSFTFKANDGTDDSNIATIRIDIGNINDPPTSNAQSVVTNEDTQKAISVTANDSDGDTLQYIMVNNVQFGSISGALPNVVYTPDLNYFGSDSFSFKVNDGLADSNTSTVSITVNPVNDPPVVYDVNATLNEDTSIHISDIPYQQVDVENDPLSLIIITSLSHGILSGEQSDLIYTPFPNYYGTDCLTFKVNDGEFDSNVATGCAIILSVNDPPVTNNTSIQTDEDAPRSIKLNATDVENDSLTYQVFSSPSHGVISGTPPNLVYTPDQNYGGDDSFQYRAHDGSDYSNINTISITVNPVNDPPIAYSMNFTTPEDTPFMNAQTVASDVEGDTLTYILVTPQLHGALSGTPPLMTYTPDVDYVGPDSLTFKVNDGEFDSNVATLFMEVGPIDDQPVTYPKSVLTDEDIPLDIVLEASDADDDPLTYQIVALPSHGSLSGILPNTTYTPTQNYFGSDSFSFKVNDGLADSNTSTVSITVNPVNDPPVAYDVNATVYEDVPFDAINEVLQSVHDVENDPVTYVFLTPLSHGTISGVYPNLTYTPNLNYYGTACTEFQYNDGMSDSNVATACAIIRPVNDRPIANNQQIAIESNTLSYITLTASDVENNTLTYNVISTPAHGILFGSAPDLRYLPNKNYVGTDQFTFKANDGNATSLPATISITMSQAAQEPSQDTTSSSGDSNIIPIPRISDFGIYVNGEDAPKNSVSYNLENRVPMTQTLTVDTDEKIRLYITLDDEEASTKIIHFGLYTNIRKTSSDIKNSNAYIIFDMGSPVKVVDTEGIFKDAKLNTSYKGRSMIVDVALTFEKPMETSDVILEVWNHGRHPIYETIPGIIQVTENKDNGVSNVVGSVNMPEQKSKEPLKVSSTADGKVTEIKNNGVVVLKNKDMGITVSGHIDSVPRGEKVKITILRPDDSISTVVAYLNTDSSYVVLGKLNKKWLDGFYEIMVSYMDKEEGKIRLFVTDKEPPGGQYPVILGEPETISVVFQYINGNVTKEDLISYLKDNGWSKPRIDDFIANNRQVYVNPYTFYYLAALVPLLYVLVSFLSKDKNRKKAKQ